MDSLSPGSRVSFYDSTGRLVGGVVESTIRMANGMQVVRVKCDSGSSITLPAAGLFQG
ncbi:uncharacterized protein BT62DRAFT_1013307 [Guyanagaster necrorhizus]|uniref:Uncharacterized protein n=1 Tax=Guyanagaster necrorhizus TaxID=856835 RepID=A0A9P7VFZ1_9AGAR|nr:uncharacterized protein BT62DRAFT_1013307 [Guyanagaster necrorhizus MCA 3950]KAG7439868.1 hypothetical protein BT62DRAFT_1013307 [Guyanagaster necrorhizus MCA 3950]